METNQLIWEIAKLSSYLIAVKILLSAANSFYSTKRKGDTELAKSFDHLKKKQS